MASYTGIQLSGAGTPNEALNATTPYTFSFTTPSTLSGSSILHLKLLETMMGFMILHLL